MRDRKDIVRVARVSFERQEGELVRRDRIELEEGRGRSAVDGGSSHQGLGGAERNVLPQARIIRVSSSLRRGLT